MAHDSIAPTKEELKARLDAEIFYTLLPEKGKDIKAFRSYTEYFDESPGGALRFVPLYLADDIMRNYTFVTLKDTNEVYVYDKEQGIYRPGGEALIRALTAINLEKMHRRNYGEEVLYHIKVSTYKEREELKPPDALLVLKNGLYHIPTGNLYTFTPDIFALNHFPVIYDANADCPKIKAFVSEIVNEENQRVLQEVVGYCLKHGYPYQKAFMLVGDGANGKSTFLSLLITFLGQENISSISLQDLVYHKFASAELYGKLANVYDDLSQDALKRTGQFKMATGGGLLKGERKFKNPFFFTNEAKLIFSTNQIPEADDNTTAFFRRWVLINFPNKFLDDDADIKLLEKLTTEEELSGFFNWTLEGLARLDVQEGFSYTRTVEEVQIQYERMSNPIKAFKQDHLLVDSTSIIPKNKLYSHYVVYCIDNDLPAKAKNAFSMALYRVLPHLEETRIREGKKRIQCWRGVRYSEDIIIDNPDLLDQGDLGAEPGDQGGQGGQGLDLFKAVETCAFCGIPLNAETGKFMDSNTQKYYCRQHWMAKKRAGEDLPGEAF